MLFAEYMMIVFCGIMIDLVWQQSKQSKMKLSARNQLKGKIVKVDEGLITSKVVLDLGCGNIISAIISKDAIADLELKPGMEAFAIIKSTEVIIGTPCDCKKENNKCGCH
jgi:molybdopterin-binding protein